MKTAGVLASILLAATGAVAQTKPSSTSKGVEEPASQPTLNVITVQGCFDDPGELVFNATLQFNTKGACAQDVCFASGYPVAATSGGNQCYCGKKYPNKKSLVDDSKCNVGCAGYDLQACGGVNFWTVYNTGLTLSVDTSGEASQIKGGPGSETSAPVKTVTGSTVVVTETSDTTPKSSGPNVGAIAGGVVVAVVLVASSVAGFFFYMRRKRNREIEEEHRRNAAVNSFISGKAPSSAGSITDARLDPVMAQRRMSDGSIADNEDYSRKILRVSFVSLVIGVLLTAAGHQCVIQPPT
ncbi:putative wsc domain protein [Echria macrotheca]|uniref:Wsc domain protein n=1 Tax=Echria macrotheca TaxID=438768 RepID=A0AAJ0F9H0_9PEZI|nr:putative wsc domain protein [Echria macrotheca]